MRRLSETFATSALPAQAAPGFNAGQSDEERASYDNLLLLCATHHRVVDADPATYTVDTVRQLKRSRAARTKSAYTITDGLAQAALVTSGLVIGAVIDSVVSINQSGGQTGRSIGAGGGGGVATAGPNGFAVAAGGGGGGAYGGRGGDGGGVSVNVTSHNQQGGVTAHTINQAPAPEIQIIRQSVAAEGEWCVANLVIEVVTPYPAANLYLEARSEGIEEFDVSPMRGGMFSFGHTGKREGFCFTNVQQAYGEYSLTIRSKSKNVQLRHSFD